MTSSSWFTADCNELQGVELRIMSTKPLGPSGSPQASRTPPVPSQVGPDPQVSPPLQMGPSQVRLLPVSYS
ncbi:hypothetical protein SKAU_G00079150 [Synaphobranchus kaupii]|uniref:Uncharacterized protein n=1 Tax=Synaphobranchus kaupii TaxID=118154 RepID=A0A9Q1FUL7_SYNKA|nr:hypothetical protein SKAU_G00079150 [Synaphobranchus kaupii]